MVRHDKVTMAAPSKPRDPPEKWWRMNPLDDTTPDWRKPELLQLRDLLLAAYDRRRQLRRLAKLAGLAHGIFPRGGDLASTCFELIEALIRQGICRGFVEHAAQDPAVAAYHDQFRKLLDAGPGGSPDGGSVPRWRIATTELAAIQRQRLLRGRARFVRTELASELAERVGSVALLTVSFGTEEASGTGFLIDDRLLLTAYHNLCHDGLGPATAITVNFDYDETPRGSQLVLRAETAPVAGDAEADWAVLRVERPTGRVPLTVGSRFPVLPGNPLVIIQHPRGGLKRLAFEHQAVTSVSDEHLQYVVDTVPGSSGSPVCDEGANVVAIHLCDVEQPVEIDGEVMTVWRNQGLLIAPILQQLERVLHDNRESRSER
ncbi:putative serine protease HTRA3 [Actinoplanes sp. SE50]|nr:putative serine protease HTRA3 [Actinoplanes sp. SE50/110]ATO82611.1 putative serine protease HTRA3 [Actinoplanes sp. SE50]SLM00018.1 putative serine protease HTRA3 [Actinoplanes sp. SE50/110]